MMLKTTMVVRKAKEMGKKLSNRDIIWILKEREKMNFTDIMEKL